MKNIHEIAQAIRALNSTTNNTGLTQTEKQLMELLRKNNAVAEQRLQRAISERHSKATMTMNIRAIAQRKDVLSLEVSMTLLPLDKPNANKQAVARSEKDNIITSALYKPIRANFTGLSMKGHSNTSDVGVITEVWEAQNNIYANGTIWLERNEDVGNYLQSKADHGGSFELYFARSETRNGIEWLQDTVFAAHAIVDRPAYGKDTPIRVK